VELCNIIVDLNKQRHMKSILKVAVNMQNEAKNGSANRPAWIMCLALLVFKVYQANRTRGKHDSAVLIIKPESLRAY